MKPMLIKILLFGVLIRSETELNAGKRLISVLTESIDILRKIISI